MKLSTEREAGMALNPKRVGQEEPSERRYWAFSADPARYRVRDAVTDLTTDWWTTKNKPIRAGDKTIIWQTRDSAGRRGVVALGEVVANPQPRSDAGNPYWVNPQEAAATAERCQVRYIPITESLWVDGAEKELLNTLSVARARGGTVFHVTPDQWEAVVAAAGLSARRTIESDIEEIRNRQDLTPTQKEALIQARRGQGKFRRGLMEYWGSCAVVGCALPSVLRASHIKPWKKSTDAERLDVANGLLLIANLDALFNDGLITFDDDGQMLVSNGLAQNDRAILQLEGGLSKKPTAKQRSYLRFHRENEFRQT
jgi:hypothetical protein